VIGDAAAATGPDCQPLPGVAPVAKQQGCYVANLLMARAEGKTLPAFHYRDLGSMATIGRKRAVAQLGTFKVSGFPAWLLWSLAHIYFLIGFRNRLTVVCGCRSRRRGQRSSVPIAFGVGLCRQKSWKWA